MGGAIPLADDSREAQPDFEYRMVAADGRVVWWANPRHRAGERSHNPTARCNGGHHRAQAGGRLVPAWNRRISSILRTIRFSFAI